MRCDDPTMDFTAVGVPQIGSVINGGGGRDPITSASFHSDGVNLFVACEGDNSLRVVDCQTGKSDSPPLRFEREGIKLVEAT